MKVLLVTSELTPIAKVGGLGDVIGALPIALKKLGVDARVVMPKYGLIDETKYPCKLEAKNIEIRIDSKRELIDIYSTLIPNSSVLVYLIDNKKYFGDKTIYQSRTAFAKGITEVYKFSFFAKSIFSIFSSLKWQPDIINCNDWYGGLMPFFIKLHSLKIKTLFTIHNLANQGPSRVKSIFKFLGINEKIQPNLKKKDRRGYFNLMQQGILGSDLISTVSPTYAKEILTKEYGCVLEKDLEKRRKDLFGIVNGIDVNRFNPETDSDLKYNYSLENLDEKIKNKIELQKELNLPVNPDIPFLGLVSRLTYQKGIKLIVRIIPELVKANCQLVVLGVGEDRAENNLKELAKKFPKNISAQIKFDASLAQKIYAASDIFLMPSLFEPCGLGQLISMRYGTITVARATGGLKDTIKNLQFPISNLQDKPTGFLFEKFTSKELLKTIRRALDIYQDKKTWRQLQNNCMEQNFSWENSAKEYIKLYRKLKSLN